MTVSVVLEKLSTETEKFLSSFHRACVFYLSVAETKAFITNYIFRFFVVVLFLSLFNTFFAGGVFFFLSFFSFSIKGG